MFYKMKQLSNEEFDDMTIDKTTKRRKMLFAIPAYYTVREGSIELWPMLASEDD